MSSRACSCGKGYCSVVDRKCRHCRTKREQEVFDRRFDPTFGVHPAARRLGFQNETLK